MSISHTVYCSSCPSKLLKSVFKWQAANAFQLYRSAENADLNHHKIGCFHVSKKDVIDFRLSTVC